MWRTVRNVLIGLALAVFLVWTGLIWAILGAIPVWTYVTVGVLIAVLIAFIKWAWAQNEMLPSSPIYESREVDVVDAEIVDD
jgi:hypothetical protein